MSESLIAVGTGKRRSLRGMRLVKEGPVYGHYDAKVPLREARNVYDLMAPVVEVEFTESFYMLPLDAMHRIKHQGWVPITRGILNSSLVHAREVFRAALVANAYSIILVHNHPSGDPIPSASDLEVTRQLVDAGKLLGIDVIDHVIIGDGRFVSFAESGLLI